MQKISRKRFEWLKQKHYELWDWLSKNPDACKSDWFTLGENRGIRAANNCFACEFDNEIKGVCCGACPLICDRIDEKECLGGLYKKYSDAKIDYRVYQTSAFRDKVIELAKLIRDLPWSEEYVEDKEMNNENYIVINGKKAELTEEQLKQLGIEVDKPKRKRVEDGYIFFFVDRGNCIDSRFDNRFALSNYCYDTHNYFQTEEEAKEYAEVLEIKRQLMKFADEHNEKINWDKLNEPKYYLYLTRPTDEIIIGNTYKGKIPEIIYFSSTAIAHQSIDAIGKDNIIKYLTYNY